MNFAALASRIAVLISSSVALSFPYAILSLIVVVKRVAPDSLIQSFALSKLATISSNQYHQKNFPRIRIVESFNEVDHC